MSEPKLSFVIPLYNESESFAKLVERLNTVISTIPLTTEVVLIDDGSSDNTPVLMQQLALTDEKYNCVFLARNYGHQIALSAGLANSRATEAVMIIDGDLQDPPELLMTFYSKFQEGYEKNEKNHG